MMAQMHFIIFPIKFRCNNYMIEMLQNESNGRFPTAKKTTSHPSSHIQRRIIHTGQKLLVSIGQTMTIDVIRTTCPKISRIHLNFVVGSFVDVSDILMYEF